MNRLIALGCSVTYGHGLPDCFIPPSYPDIEPSKLSWPSIIARYMNRKCINLAACGSSNKKIWHTLLNFEFEQSDIVFILWTYLERSTVIKKDRLIDIGPWTDNQLYYKELYDEHDSEIMTKLFVSHANMILNAKGVTVYNLTLKNSNTNIFTLGDRVIEHIPIYINDMRELYPYALDNRHPGIECNEIYSKRILDFLKIENDLPNHIPLTRYKRLVRNLNKMKKKL